MAGAAHDLSTPQLSSKHLCGWPMFVREAYLGEEDVYEFELLILWPKSPSPIML
ncbi:uncharacterized protein J3R85_017022 [Psidium guajava]|nr:uncharacterized protein J3R85_017022 [Psidium guajava]